MKNISSRIQTLLGCIVVFLITSSIFFHPITDFAQDLGRHIKLGEIIWLTHAVPKTNLFAYTYPNFPFINSHWLSEVVFYLFNKSFGAFGLLFVMSTLAACSTALLFYFVSKRTTVFTTLITTLLYLGILLERVFLRPEIFSFFFMSVFVIILYNFRENSLRHSEASAEESHSIKNTKYKILNTKYLIFLLPFLELLWVNMHIYFAVGPILVLLFLLDSVILNLFQNPTKISNFKFQISKLLTTNYLLLATVFFLTCLATLLNPNGLTGAVYPLTVFSNYGYTIAENQTLFFLLNYGFRNVSYLYFGITVIALFILLLINRKRTSLIDWFLFIVFSILAVSATRNFPLFVFATFIPFARNLSSFFRHPALDAGSMDSRLRGNDNTNKKTAAWLVLCVVGTTIILYLSIQANGIGYGISQNPENAVNFFITHHLKGPIFNNFDIGSYLDYRLYPKERVFVDGRPEAYPVDFFQKEYIPMQEDPKIFVRVDEKYHFNTIFFSHTDQTPWANTFLTTILTNPNWKLIYLDDTIIILVKNTPENSSLIPLSENDIVLGKISLPPDYNSLARMTKVVEILKWKNAEIVVLQKMLSLQPHSCDALRVLGNLLMQKNDPSVGIYANQYQQFCQ